MRDAWLVALMISILIVAGLTFYFLSPLLDGLIMGIVFAYVAKPLKKKIEFLGNVKSSIIATLVVIIPISVLMIYGIFQGISQAVYIITHHEYFEAEFLILIKKLGFDERAEEYVRQLFPSFISLIQSIFRLSAFDFTKKLILFVLNFFISAIVCFYSLTDSEKFLERTTKIIPEERRDEFRSFIKELDETYLSLWFGNFVVALLIGLASIPFFLYFNVPFAPLLSGLMFLAALIPVFAEWMIILPVSVYLMLIDLTTGIYFLALGVVFLYVLPELILRPYFVGYTSKIHPLVLMLAFLGGGVVGGITGFFLAPMLAGALTAIYHYYTK
jgi:predicted PurR-regulated permease PerM